MNRSLSILFRSFPALALWVELLFLSTSSGNAAPAPRPQLVSFSQSVTNVAVGQTSVAVVIQRFSGIGTLSVDITAQSPAPGTPTTTLTAAFAATSKSVTVSVPVPTGPSVINNVMYLELMASVTAAPSGISRQALRFVTAAPTGPQNVLNGVIFSGAASPVDAVLCSGTSALVRGGIVALGGTPGIVPAATPARFQPDPNYAKGVWIPPLTPNALVLRLNQPLNSQAAP